MAKPKPMDLVSQAIQHAGAEVLSTGEDAQSVKLFFRIKNKRFWCEVLEYVLSRKKGWDAHVCQQYFISAGKLKYGWNFMLQAENISQAASAVRDLFVNGTQVMSQLGAEQPGPIQSFPLVGASPNRNRPMVRDPKTGLPVHRGAYSIAAPKG